MKRSRFTESQIIRILREVEGGRMVKDVCREYKQRVISFLLRHDFVYPGKKPWTKTYFIWLSKVSLKHPAQKIALQEDIDAVHECTGRVKRLSEQISLAVEEWRMAPTVKALQSLRGVSLIIAAITVAELQRGQA